MEFDHAITKDATEDELINIEELLSETKETDWLTQSDETPTDIQVSFSQLTFSSPSIKHYVENIYQNGNSKKVLHNLLYWSDRMSISCDNCGSLKSPSKTLPTSISFTNNAKYRHSIAITDVNLDSYEEDDLTMQDNNSETSPTDSLNTSQYHENEANGNSNCLNLAQVTQQFFHGDNNRMTQSSISDYKLSMSPPQISNEMPQSYSSANPNILSRTYDKEELENLKKSQISQSVYVANSKSNKRTRQADEKPTSPVMVRSFTTKSSSSMKNKLHNKRLFPTAVNNTSHISSKTTTTATTTRQHQPRLYNSSRHLVGVDKVQPADDCESLPSNYSSQSLPVASIVKRNVDTKQLLLNKCAFESDVVTTPINTPVHINHKHRFNSTKSKLKPPTLIKRNLK